MMGAKGLLAGVIIEMFSQSFGKGSGDFLEHLGNAFGGKRFSLLRADQERVVLLYAVIFHIFLHKQRHRLAHRYLANRGSVLYVRRRISDIIILVLVVSYVHPVTLSLLPAVESVLDNVNRKDQEFRSEETLMQQQHENRVHAPARSHTTKWVGCKFCIGTAGKK